MHLAIQSDFDNIKSIFYQHKAWFPHVRTDYMRQMIDLQRCIYSHGVVLTFHTAKRKQTIGTVKVNKGDTVLHQIANSTPGNGNGTKILLQFFDWCKQDVYLSVKTDNHKACNFYSKLGMKDIGEHNWANDKVKGRVYVKWKN